jgi:hypothetical protein
MRLGVWGIFFVSCGFAFMAIVFYYIRDYEMQQKLPDYLHHKRGKSPKNIDNLRSFMLNSPCAAKIDEPEPQ